MRYVIPKEDLLFLIYRYIPGENIPESEIHKLYEKFGDIQQMVKAVNGNHYYDVSAQPDEICEKRKQLINDLKELK